MNELSWSGQLPFPLLFSLQALPWVGALAVWLYRDRPWSRWLGRGVALAELALAGVLVARLDAGNPVMQFAERLDGLGYHVAADGMSALFVLLAALVVVLLTLYGMVRQVISFGQLLAVMLAFEGSLMLMLLTLNLAWFLLAWGLQLALLTYLMHFWATTLERRHALSRFVQYQVLGWFLFIAGCVVLGWNHADVTGGRWSFDLFDLERVPPEGKFQSAAFFLLFYGLAVRTPLFPLHGWLPNQTRHGMLAVAPVMLLGVKVGIYGIARFVLALTPEAVLTWQLYVVAFAMTGIFYTAFLACLQTNLRRLLAFAVVSHTGLIIIGLFTLHPSGLQGAILLATNFGLAVTVMLFMVGFVFKRTRTSELSLLGGLFDRIPFVAVAFLVGGLSIVGMPGTPGFDAAHLLYEAAIERFGALPTVAAALGNVVAAGFLLFAFQKAFLAPPPAGSQAIEPVAWIEYWVGGISLGVLLLAGFFPEPWLNLTDATTRALVARFAGG
ncbi:MAG: hypothetical protein RIR00_465 [Pseudomonadota bacterium]